MIRAYYSLIKPGIVWSNAMTAAAGFFLAASYPFDLLRFSAMLFGLALVIAGSCAANNVIDRDIDARMERTKNRAVAANRISPANAAAFAGVLGGLGFAILFFLTNLLAFLAALFGAAVYLALYTPLKRRTEHGTLIGAFSGSAPPVVGYAAAAHAIDGTALVLFLILLSWQMIHFFAIAIFRIDEYRAAGIPVLPLTQDVSKTKRLMLAYLFLFWLSALALFLIGSAGLIYAAVMTALSIGWLLLALKGFGAPDERGWARRMFFYSLIVLLVFSATIAFY